MRIAGFIRLWPTHRGVGGMQGHAMNLYRGLAARGHDVHVLTTYHESRPELEIEHGVHVHYLPGCPPAVYSEQYFTAAAQKLDALHRQRNFDIIHSESDCARRHTGGPIPVVVTWHGIAYCSYRSRLNLAVLETEKARHIEELHKTTENILKEMSAIPKYDHSIAISDQAYADLINVYGLSRNKVSLVFNGFDTKQFAPDSAAKMAIRKQHNIPDDAFLIGVVGRIVPDKGHRQLTAILKKVVGKNHKVYCMVVGEGALVSDYERLNLKQVVIVGAKSYIEMPKYYNAFDLFINPTTRYLGLDMSIQEAMLCGTPVLASDVGSIKQSLMPHAGLGITFAFNDTADLADKILALSSKSDLKQIGLAGREHVKTICSIEQMCLGTENACKKAMQSRIK